MQSGRKVSSCFVCVGVCVCVRDRERERKRLAHIYIDTDPHMKRWTFDKGAEHLQRRDLNAFSHTTRFLI